nr:hypothetical protein [uncultured Butyrivibrio sp.]
MSKKFKHISLVIEIVVLILLIYPYLRLAFFANIAQDDYCFLENLSYLPESSFFIKIVNFSQKEYMRWQGTYFTNMMAPIVYLPFLKFGNIYVQLWMFGGILLWFVSLLYLVHSIFAGRIKDKTDRWLSVFAAFFAVILMILYNAGQIKDTFYWLNGIIAYTLAISFAFFSFGLQIKNDRKILCSVLCVILSFLAVGGPLNVAALTCGVAFLLTVYRAVRRQKISRSLITFFASLAGAIINVISPGNYSRYEGEMSIGDVIAALQQSANWVAERNWQIIADGTVLVMIIAVVISLKYAEKYEKVLVNPVLLIVLLFIGEVIVDFPVLLGVGRLEDRTQFIGKTVAAVFMLIILLDVIGWIIVRFDLRPSDKWNPFVMFIVAGIVLFVLLRKEDTLFPMKIYEDMSNGTLARYEAANDYMLEVIYQSEKDTDVVVEINDYPRISYVKGAGVLEDPDTWVNTPISRVFGLKSLSVIYKD